MYFKSNYLFNPLVGFIWCSGYESQNSQPVLNGQNLGYNLEKDKGPGGGLALADGHSRQSSSGGDSNCGR